MKHKLRVDSELMGTSSRRWRWYVTCSCGWTPRTPCFDQQGVPWFGRPTWSVALAEGVAHQRAALYPFERSHSA